MELHATSWGMLVAMCDYCDCRSQPQIAALSAEHEQLLALAAAIRRQLAAGRSLRPELDGLIELLAPHAHREEVGLFAALRDAGVEGGYVGRFEVDHRDLEDLLERAQHDVGAAASLVELLEDHILREETDMFPAARQLLDAAMWEAVDEAVSQTVAGAASTVRRPLTAAAPTHRGPGS
jgi:hemerythrin-like domain-containing protein